MQSLRQIGAGLLLSAFSVVIVLGGLSLALAEGGMASVASPTAANLPTGEVITAIPTLPISFTNTPRGLNFTATVPLSPLPTLINCPPPVGWLPITVQSSDTLAELAQTYHITMDALQKGNCLLNQTLITNSILYVPAQSLPTLKVCGAPADWGTYTVAAGDTLYAISLLYRISWQQLMQANCLDTSYIKTGQLLRVPNVLVSTMTLQMSTNTPVPTIAETLEITSTPSIPTETETLPAMTEVPTLTETTIPASETPLPSEPETTPTP